MNYTDEFDQAVIDRYKAAPAVRQVAVRMGQTEKSIELKSAGMSITQHRIAEMDYRCDWGEVYTEAPEMILHHSKNAVDLIDSAVRIWCFPAATSGLRNLHNEAINSIKTIRQRIDPALYGIERELDPCKAARNAYDAIENKALRAFRNLFDSANTVQIPPSKLRTHHVNGIRQTVTDFQNDLRIWAGQLQERIGSS